MDSVRVTRAAKAKALAHPVWITETPRTRTRTPANKASKRKKTVQSDSHPEDEDTDRSGDRTSKPKRRRGKKARNEEHEPMQVDQVGTHLEHSDPPPPTTELATLNSSSTRSAPTQTQPAMQEGTESTKAQAAPRPVLPRNRSPSPPAQPRTRSRALTSKPPRDPSVPPSPPQSHRPSQPQSLGLSRSRSRSQSRSPPPSHPRSQPPLIPAPNVDLGLPPHASSHTHSRRLSPATSRRPSPTHSRSRSQKPTAWPPRQPSRVSSRERSHERSHEQSRPPRQPSPRRSRVPSPDPSHRPSRRSSRRPPSRRSSREPSRRPSPGPSRQPPGRPFRFSELPPDYVPSRYHEFFPNGEPEDNVTVDQERDQRLDTKHGKKVKGNDPSTTDGSDSEDGTGGSEGVTSDGVIPAADSLLKERPVLSTPDVSASDEPRQQPLPRKKKAMKTVDAKVTKPADTSNANSKVTNVEGAPKATTRKPKATDVKSKKVTRKSQAVNKKDKVVNSTGAMFPAILQSESSDEDGSPTPPVKSSKGKSPVPKITKRLKKRQDEQINLTSDEDQLGDDEDEDDEDDTTDDAPDGSDGHWPAYTTVLKSSSGHVAIGIQDSRVQLILDKALALADQSFYFIDPYLEYPNKLNAFRRLLLSAAEDKEVGDEMVYRRWKVDRRQMMIAKGVPENRFCNNRLAVKRQMRSIVPMAYNLDVKKDCVGRVAELLKDRRYIYAVKTSSGHVEQVDRKRPFQHPAIVQGLATCFFSGSNSAIATNLDSDKPSIFYGSDHEPLCPIAMVCLISAAIEHCLLEWQSGYYQTMNFTVNSSWATYTAHLDTIKGIFNDPDPKHDGPEACNFILSTLYEKASLGQLYNSAIRKVVRANLEHIDLDNLPVRRRSKKNS